MEPYLNFLRDGGLLTAASLCLALSTGIAVLSLLGMGRRKTKKKSDAYDYEQMRRQKIREEDGLFRQFEGFVLELLPLNKDSSRLEAIRKALPHIARRLPWTAEEFFATQQVGGILLGTAIGIVFWSLVHPVAGLFVGFLTGYLFVEMQLKSILDEAAMRRNKISMQLPFAVDLMSLTRGAGATFPESIEVIASECSGSPLGDEFAETVRQVSLGRTQKQVFDELADRVETDDFRELAFVLNKADELGTPVAEALSELAEQMRLRRQQRGEKASGEAQVKIMFPGTIMMVACLIVIVTPFILQAVYAQAVP